MKDSIRNIIQENVIDIVEGGVSVDIMTLLDTAIDEGYLSQTAFSENELDIMRFIDENIFTCEVCDWTMPIEEMSSENQVCKDCSNDY